MGQGKHPRDQNTPASRVPNSPPESFEEKAPFPGARQHPPWCSRPAKVPVVRVLSRYKLGVRLGRVLLHISLAHSSGRGLSPASLQLTPANVGWGGGEPLGQGPHLPPSGRPGAGGALRCSLGLSARHSHLPCSRARPGSLRRSAAAPAARARGDAGTLRTARHPPGVAQRQHGPAAPGRVRVPAQATGLVPRSLLPPALPSSRPLPRPGGAPGGTLRPSTEQATRWRPPIAPSLSLHRDVSSLGGYL